MGNIILKPIPAPDLFSTQWIQASHSSLTSSLPVSRLLSSFFFFFFFLLLLLRCNVGDVCGRGIFQCLFPVIDIYIYSLISNVKVPVHVLASLSITLKLHGWLTTQSCETSRVESVGTADHGVLWLQRGLQTVDVGCLKVHLSTKHRVTHCSTTHRIDWLIDCFKSS